MAKEEQRAIVTGSSETSADTVLLPEHRLAHIRQTRRHPGPTQFDYLHMRYLVDDLSAALRRIARPGADVLDVYCGTRPYDDLLPAPARVVGLDVEGNTYGVADVLTNDFLPFPDGSFDLVMCIEAFHYVKDPVAGVAEIGRVLRPGGWTTIAVPLVWEYDRTIFEHRYTGPELASLFEGWQDVDVIENGGRAVSWATLTGSIVNMGESHVAARLGLRTLLRPVFISAYLAINGVGFALDWAERRYARSPFTLPMNLLLTARRAPADIA